MLGGAVRIVLFRAAEDTYVHTGSTSFARRKRDARAYQDNPGFGGPHLYRLELEVDDEHVLDLRGSTPNFLLALLDRLGAAGIDYAVTVDRRVQAAILGRGYRWVRFFDSFPEDCETWALLCGPGDFYGDDEVSPCMVPV